MYEFYLVQKTETGYEPRELCYSVGNLLHEPLDIEKGHEGEADGELGHAVGQHVGSVAHLDAQLLHQRQVDVVVPGEQTKKQT